MTFFKKPELMIFSALTLVLSMISLSAHAEERPDYQKKYVCIDSEAGNRLEFILSYEAQIGLDSLVITSLDREACAVKGNRKLLQDRYILPATKMINFRYTENETGENLVTLEGIKNSVVAPDERFNKFNANIKIRDGKFSIYCKDEDLV